ncbi:UDP-N-acetylmuramoyl-tripeptide--D-alanyl-D-alanine ligase [Patiriisocius marinistellae]|uniref:UDP-N-acetylmuramoyl-tripeptide--D-alanyl-D-alanine ligase n=1 Tax=Patiriisocius marinistellae TaxID=2494560 RepID=A0A5J4FZH6_9FLAO|nr:UDP-N-acetylmuramoyl-tripeptide--D-alanyl-D-alanine ligase [Patiriisocius marinistellae]GEQ85586.1 UDP-N-acetylmuramoyl-tripeptide--D-alanyl-D-alanine ligase [Patiriisocius marinistellae]
MKIETLHNLFLKSTGVCTDTRKITKGCLFIALKGANFNGNVFAQEALNQGAYKVLIDDEKEHKNTGETILCKNTLTELQRLASYHRTYLDLPIIALTGSNGKTTTKELINSVLKQKYKTTATVGNLNNHIGVPLTLLSMTKETEMGIVEMGANHLREIANLCEIAKPNYGYITNFGKAHLEGFGSIEGVVKGKSEMYAYLIENKQHVFLNADDPLQNKILSTYIKKYGFSQVDKNYYKIKFIKADPFVKLKIEDTDVETQLIGAYNFSNISAAAIIGKYFNVSLWDIKYAIENYKPTNNRSQIIIKNNNEITLDAYNANPSSMEAALKTFSSNKLTSNNTSEKRKVAILGDMFELGSEAKKEHQHIADLAAELAIDKIILVGENFSTIKNESKKIIIFSSFQKLLEAFSSLGVKEASVLIKGSRGMALERVLDLL